MMTQRMVSSSFYPATKIMTNRLAHNGGKSNPPPSPSPQSLMENTDIPHAIKIIPLFTHRVNAPGTVLHSEVAETIFPTNKAANFTKTFLLNSYLELFRLRRFCW